MTSKTNLLDTNQLATHHKQGSSKQNSKVENAQAHGTYDTINQLLVLKCAAHGTYYTQSNNNKPTEKNAVCPINSTGT